jgi:hypothetical protein
LGTPLLPPLDPSGRSPLWPSDWPWLQMADRKNFNTFANPDTNTVPSNVTAAGTAWLRNAKLVSGVGPMQPNVSIDVALLQRLINEAYTQGYIRAFHMPLNADGPNHTLAVNGIWQPGAPVNRAILDLEKLYFHGRANPKGGGVVDPGGELFTFLVQIVQLQRLAEQHLAVGMEQLGDAMMVGDAANVKQYLPLLLDAMTDKNLQDTGMILILLADIRCETTTMDPIEEGISKFNTAGHRSAPTKGHKTGVFIPDGDPFALYDRKTGIGNNAVGDGALYKGRGFIQITGKANYQHMTDKLHIDLVNSPDEALKPEVAAKIAAQYMKDREESFRKALATNDLHFMRSLVNGNAELHYDLFRSTFNAGRQFVGEQIVSEATASAAKAARLATAAAAAAARRAAHHHPPAAKRHKAPPVAPGKRSLP